MQELESLQSIFKDKIFRIPDYQRGYAWTIKQLKDFWEDVVNLPPGRFHYTGLLSLKKLDIQKWCIWNEDEWLIEDRGYKPFHVVDGQQRLTTLVIFIQSISELLSDLPENLEKKEKDIYLGSFSLKAIKEAYLVIEKPPRFIIKSYKFGYEKDNPLFTFFKHRILLGPDSGSFQETFYTLNLENAKKFFKENLAEFYKQYGLTEIELLFKKLTQNLMFNVYELSDDVDVFVAFETMNNRGKKLSNLELLKNRLIYLTTLYEEDELNPDERKVLRDKINSAWKEVYYQLGKNKKNPLNDDDFLVAHWIMYFQYTREKGDDYIRFLLEENFTPQNIYLKNEVKMSSIQEFEEIKEDEDSDQEEIEINRNNEEKIVSRSKLTSKDIENYVNSLKSAALHWYNIHNPVNNPDLPEEEQLWIDRLNRIGIIYFRPLITASYLSKRINSDDRVRLFQAIEHFIFVTFRLSRAFSSYRNSEFYRAARQLRNDDLSIDTIIKRLHERMDYCFYSGENSTDVYFDYTYFQNFIEKKFKNGEGFYGWNGLRYFLYEYEMEKVRQRGSKIDWSLFVRGKKDKVTIEHIYPQNSDNKCWKESFEDYKKEELVYFQGTLGNLLPLSKSINSSLQNDCFVDKKMPKYNAQDQKIRQGYADGSHSEIEVSNYTDWNGETILERGIKLLKFMERRWDLQFENDDAMVKLLFLDFMDR